MMQNEHNQKDSDVGRNRFARGVCAAAAPIIALIFGYTIGDAFVSFFNLPSILGVSAGLGLGALGVLWLIPRLYVTNDAVSAFVTIDLLSNELVTYGPGFHFSFPWEARSGANNVALDEAAEEFEFVAQTGVGTITGKGSFRLRPDIQQLPVFLAGVGSVAADLKDLVAADCVKFFLAKEAAEPEVTTTASGNTPKPKKDSMKKALAKASELNVALAVTFKHGSTQATHASKFEERFGVIIGDVTVSELLPSKEVQKAMDGDSESAALEAIIARSLGKEDMAAVHRAVAEKTLTSEHVTAATKLAMALTDNLHGMDLRDQNFNLKISGDPEIVESLRALGPAAAALFAANQQKGKK